MGIYGDLLKLNDMKAITAPQKREQKPAVRVETATGVHQTENTPKVINQSTVTRRFHDTKQPRNHATTVSRYHDTLIQAIRNAVKLFGKEAATHRFTLEEKKALAGVVYTYKQQDLKTSENEITRIGVNFILDDYQENGEGSILHRVLTALNS